MVTVSDFAEPTGINVIVSESRSGKTELAMSPKRCEKFVPETQYELNTLFTRTP